MQSNHNLLADQKNGQFTDLFIGSNIIICISMNEGWSSSQMFCPFFSTMINNL